MLLSADHAFCSTLAYQDKHLWDSALPAVLSSVMCGREMQAEQGREIGKPPLVLMTDHVRAAEHHADLSMSGAHILFADW